MDLVDLLDTHTVMYLVHARTALNLLDCMMTTYDIPDVVDSTPDMNNVFQCMFQFDTSNSNVKISIIFKFNEPLMHVSSGDQTLTLQVEMWPTAYTADTTTITIRAGDAENDYWVTGTGWVLDNNVTYSLQGVLQWEDDDQMRIGVILNEYDPTKLGRPTWMYGLATTVFDWKYTSTYAYEAEPIEARVWIDLTNFVGQFRLYELEWVGNQVNANYTNMLAALWSGNRYMLNSYWSHSAYAVFLLPPISVMDGSAYDRTSILEEIITDQFIEIYNLKDELAAGGTFFDWLSDSLELAWDFWSNVFSGEGNFKWSVLDDALSQVITAGADALIGVFE